MPTEPRRGAVIIPAHNEAASISRSLQELLADAATGELDVVVACNGCTDDTAAVAGRTASRLGHRITVLDLAVASKVAAMQQAEAVTAPPRAYLDADVSCPTATVRQLLDAVAQGAADVAVPRRQLDLGGAGVLATLYHRTWSELPWVREQLAGRGAFALSEAARTTFGAWPDVVADDRYATTRVSRNRAVIVPGAVRVSPSRRLRDVVRVRGRVYAGNQLVAAPAHDAGAARRARGLLALASRPSRWPGIAVFAAVTTVAKLDAQRRARTGVLAWSRDPQRGAA